MTGNCKIMSQVFANDIPLSLKAMEGIGVNTNGGIESMPVANIRISANGIGAQCLSHFRLLL